MKQFFGFVSISTFFSFPRFFMRFSVHLFPHLFPGLFPAFFVILFFSLNFAVAAEKPTNTNKILCSFSVLESICKEIVGASSKLECELLIPTHQDPHLFELTPRAIKRIKEATVLFVNGAGFEHWLNRSLLVDSSVKVVEATEGVKLRPRDPHAWQDPLRGIQYGKNLHLALIRKYPEEEKKLKPGWEKFKSSLTQIQDHYRNQFLPLKQKRLVVSHQAFDYLAEAYQLEIRSLHSFTTGDTLSPRRMKELIQWIQKEKVQALFIEKLQPGKTMESLARESGISLSPQFLYSDQLAPAGESPNSYLDLIKYNAETILQTLKKGSHP